MKNHLLLASLFVDEAEEYEDEAPRLAFSFFFGSIVRGDPGAVSAPLAALVGQRGALIGDLFPVLLEGVFAQDHQAGADQAAEDVLEGAAIEAAVGNVSR